MRIVDIIVEIMCWLCIGIVILITLDVIRAEIVYNQAISNIPPIIVKGE
jgi:hypothetical protein